MPPIWQGKSGPYFGARAHVDFHFRYRAEQSEFPTRNWKDEVSFEKTHFLLLAMLAVTNSPLTTMHLR